MKKPVLITSLFLLIILIIQGCDLIGGIFKTGIGIGAFAVILIVVIVFIISRRTKKG